MNNYTIVLENKNSEWLASLPDISPTFTAVGDTKQEALQELEEMFNAVFEDEKFPKLPESNPDKYKIAVDIDLDTYIKISKVAKKTGKHYTEIIQDVLYRQFGKKYHSVGIKLTSEYNEILEKIAEKTSFGNKTEAVKRLLDEFSKTKV